jgi:hypothetical protein
MRLANILAVIIGVLLIIFGIKQIAAGAEVLAFVGMIFIGLILAVIGFINYMKLRRG